MATQSQLGNWDIIGIIAYLAILLAIGIYFRRFSAKGIENYFLAGRQLPGWVNGVSAAATAMNADVAPTYCGMTVISGVFIYWFFISRFGLALMVAAVLFAVFWWRLKLFTSPEFYELRFSGKLATTMRSWIAFRSAFISIVAWTGAGLLGLHKVLQPTLGWSQMTTFSVVIPVVLIYVFLSGYIGVVFSDVLQSVIVAFSYIVLCVMVLKDFGGPAGLYTGLVDTFGTEVVRWYPPIQHEMLGIVGIFAWIVGTAIGYGGDAAPMGGAMEGQRIFSSRSPLAASRMYIWALIVLFLMLSLLTMPALGAMVKWPGLHTGAINRELAFGMLISHYMPAGILWLAIAGMAASIMSTIDSNLNFGSQVVVSDVYRRFIHNTGSERHYLMIGKVVMFVIMGLAMIVALRAKNVIDIAIFMLGLSSAELSANWAQWWWWRFNAKARIAASFGGPLIFLTIKYLLFSQLSAYWQVLLAIGFTSVVWVIVSLVTEPDDEQTLLTFYKQSKPLGWWGPIAQKAGINTTRPALIFEGIGIALSGMISVSSGAMMLFHLYIGRWGLALFFALIAALLGIYFRVKYRNFLRKI